MNGTHSPYSYQPHQHSPPHISPEQTYRDQPTNYHYCMADPVSEWVSNTKPSRVIIMQCKEPEPPPVPQLCNSHTREKQRWGRSKKDTIRSTAGNKVCNNNTPYNDNQHVGGYVWTGRGRCGSAWQPLLHTSTYIHAWILYRNGIKGTQNKISRKITWFRISGDNRQQGILGNSYYIIVNYVGGWEIHTCIYHRQYSSKSRETRKKKKK